MSHPLTLRLSHALEQRLGRLAEARSSSPERLAVDAIDSYVELQEWQLEEIQKGVEAADAGDFASDEEVAAVLGR